MQIYQSKLTNKIKIETDFYENEIMEVIYLFRYYYVFKIHVFYTTCTLILVMKCTLV